MHGCILTTVATDALVLKQQVIIIHKADQMSKALDQFQIKNILLIGSHIRKYNQILKKKYPFVLGLIHMGLI